MAIYLLNLYPSKDINGAETLTWRGNNQPTAKNPLKAGDTVIVTAQFGTYTSSGAAVPISDYYGLSVGACFAKDVSSMETKLNHKGYLGILKNIAKENESQGSGDFFNNAITYKESITRNSQTQELTYQVQMTYSPTSTLQSTINGMSSPTLSIVADYGDPHKGATAVPLAQTS